MVRKTHHKMQELAPEKVFYPGMKNYVFTTTKPSGIRVGVEFIDTGVESWAERVRSEAGQDIWQVGGGELVRQFLQVQLVDEIGLTIHPPAAWQRNSTVCAAVSGSGVGAGAV